MLTQNYHAGYQFQDDQGFYSQASKENVLICHKEKELENSYGAI
jgi:hypothetical protein